VNGVAYLRERFLEDERGFTLTEVLVTTIIMMFVLLALSGLFDMSLKVFSYGNNKVEAVESARAGMEKMEREIRAAYPVDAGSNVTYLFFNANGSTSNPPQLMPTANQITFGNERGLEGAGNGKIDCLSVASCEYITYKLTDGASGINPSDTLYPPCTTASVTCTLRRVNTSLSTQAGDPVVENVAPPTIADPNRGLSFTYLKSDGTPLTAGDGEDAIGIVIVKLTVSVNQGIGHAGTQTLTTVIDLRNR
jgi:type II secretory pathway pseudopilin PulG